MLADYQASDWVLIITSISAGVTGAIAAINAGRANREAKNIHEETKHVHEEVKSVHEEVRTPNGQPVGKLIAEAETRRILDIPIGERTISEQVHTEDTPVPPFQKGTE